MRVLGAILAGGQSRRFGSDKAMALIDGRTLFERVVDILAPQTEDLAVCGRNWPGIPALVDRPGPNLGPLGGLNAALHYASDRGFDAVLCVPVDVHPLPPNLREILEGPHARVLRAQHAIGFWPVRYRLALDERLAQGCYAVRSWISISGATSISDDAFELRNINRRDDLGSWPLPSSHNDARCLT